MRSALFLIALSISGASAQEQNILPSEYPANRYSRIWENSPFNREVVAQIQSRPQSALASNFVLEGLVTDETEGSIAYLRDLREGGFLVVTKKKSPTSELFLLDAQKGTNPNETVVTISDGEETAEIRYAEGSFTKRIESPTPSNSGTDSATQAQGSASEAQVTTNAGGDAHLGEEKASPNSNGKASPPAARPRSGISILLKPPPTSSN